MRFEVVVEVIISLKVVLECVCVYMRETKGMMRLTLFVLCLVGQGLLLP